MEGDEVHGNLGCCELTILDVIGWENVDDDDDENEKGWNGLEIVWNDGDVDGRSAVPGVDVIATFSTDGGDFRCFKISLLSSDWADGAFTHWAVVPLEKDDGEIFSMTRSGSSS